VSSQTFREFAQVYKERHVLAKRLALARSIDYCLKPLIEHFGDRPLESIRTADIEDFIADLRKPRIVNRRKGLRTLAPASINRTIELMRHMLNWAVGREYLDRTPFRRGTETLIRKLQEDNRRPRRSSEDEETRLLEVAPPFLRSMIITALDTGTRQGEMLALRFGDIDSKRQLIVLRRQTTKTRSAALRTRVRSRTSGIFQTALPSPRKETPAPRRPPTADARLSDPRALCYATRRARPRRL
jgi:integrase